MGGKTPQNIELAQHIMRKYLEKRFLREINRWLSVVACIFYDYFQLAVKLSSNASTTLSKIIPV